MKKLGKLTLNEMQAYTPLSPQEQMAMKGGAIPTYQIARMIWFAWEVSETISDKLWGSQPSSSGAPPSNCDCACPPGSISIVKSDSVFVNGIKIYGSLLVCVPQ